MAWRGWAALQTLHKAYAVTGRFFSALQLRSSTIVNEIYREVQPDNPPAVRIGHR